MVKISVFSGKECFQAPPLRNQRFPGLKNQEIPLPSERLCAEQTGGSVTHAHSVKLAVKFGGTDGTVVAQTKHGLGFLEACAVETQHSMPTMLFFLSFDELLFCYVDFIPLIA